MKINLSVFVYLATLLQGFTQSFTINGYIRDSETGENLIGATIYDLNSLKGTVTNTFGFYSLTLPQGAYTFKVTYVGYQPQEVEVELTENKQLNLNLAPGTTLEEVVVTAEESLELTPQMSTIDVPIDQIKSVPVLFGEPDILKALQLLPGIQGGTEGSSGIYVRGGGPDQNLILLDGVPVYNVSHLFGFFSVFNPDAINKVTVVKGGFPARYGGRLSSVIDISMKEGNNKKFQGEGSVGIISSQLTLEGPIGKNEKTSFIVSGRRTYIDLLTRPIIRASTQGEGTGGYFFHDINAKVNHTLSDKDRLYLSFYHGLDKAFARSASSYISDGVRYKDVLNFGLTWGNTIAAVRWNHIFGPRLFSNFTGTYSKYKFRVFTEYEEYTGGTKDYGTLIEYFSGIDDVAFKVDMDYLPSPLHSIKFGTSMIRHAFNPGIFGLETTEEDELDTVIGDNKTIGWEMATYLEDDFSVGERLRFNVGSHFSSFWVNNRSYYSFQPRLSMRYLLSSKTSLKASYSTMTQYIHLLTNNGIGLPLDLWVPATGTVRPQGSWQVAIGAARTFHGLEASVEGYYKEMSRLIEYEEGATYFNLGTDWQEKVTTGDGKSYGFEFLLQKKTGRFSGWAGYTLSWTNRQFDDLNFGKTFPYKFDRRHDVSLVGVYQVNSRFSLSSTWVYGTGNAITLIESVYPGSGDFDYGGFFGGGDVNYYGERNSYRMRAYHRLDFGATWTKQKKNGERSWSAGAYNVYNRRNPFFIDLGSDSRGNPKFIQYSLFPMIPYIRYSFKF